MPVLSQYHCAPISWNPGESLQNYSVALMNKIYSPGLLQDFGLLKGSFLCHCHQVLTYRDMMGPGKWITNLCLDRLYVLNIMILPLLYIGPTIHDYFSNVFTSRFAKEWET